MRIAKFLSANGLGAAGLAMVAGGVGWYAMLMRPILAASAYGPICGHALLGPHCAACYAALGMAGVGLGLVAAGEAGRPVAAPVRIGARARRRG
ncbi:MAG: hypothetical protein P4L73_07740 [Caulobacteraceae bacterium]|nr:hypothetical protein [Caulobacteraceae bacterium]